MLSYEKITIFSFKFKFVPVYITMLDLLIMTFIFLIIFSEPFYLDDEFIGRSEYMDTISKMGLCAMKAMQQYKEPLPSSRRRIGDVCI